MTFDACFPFPTREIHLSRPFNVVSADVISSYLTKQQTSLFLVSLLSSSSSVSIHLHYVQLRKSTRARLADASRRVRKTVELHSSSLFIDESRPRDRLYRSARVSRSSSTIIGRLAFVILRRREQEGEREITCSSFLMQRDQHADVLDEEKREKEIETTVRISNDI